ncbi:MAG TPA: serine hydrolase domain-containing protein [Blastocatellia bacterium]|nr:serine hydrolase domain-containing protein [Blastocatellia bacterium]
MRIGLALALVVTTLSSSWPRAAAATRCNYDFSAVTALTQNLVDTVPLEGASVMLIKDGRVIYEQYFGSYDSSTRVPIASASKWLSAATLMTLVDEGKLSLDDPVSKYLPYFAGTKGEITIRQLFSHTSGLPPITGDAPCLYNPRTPSMDACVQQISQLELIGPPGGQFAYGENSMQVAGRICEVVSGQSWESLFQEQIAIPLEMSGATYGAGPNPIIAGGAQLGMSDYANFLRMIEAKGRFKGQRVLSIGAIREMQRNLTEGLPVVFSPRMDGPTNYGIGEWIDAFDARGRALQVSSPGLFGFNPWVDNQRGLIGIFMVQDRGPRVYPTVLMIQEKVREIVDGCACG